MKIGRTLEEYAKWVAACEEGRIGYPSVTTFARMEGGGLPSPLISEEIADSVSSALAWMARQKPRLSDVVERYYLQRQSLSTIARERKESRHLVTQALFAGETAVEVYILEKDS